MKRPYSSLLILLPMVLISVAALGQQQADAGKVSHLLEQSKYSYSKASENVWTIAFKGKTLTDFNVVVSTAEGLAIFVVLIEEKKDLKPTAEMMRKLLKLNSDLDRVKVAIDNDGDLVVRIDASLRVLDVEEFKANVEQAAAAADEVKKAIKATVIK